MIQGKLVADAITAAATHRSAGLKKLVKHRDETLQQILSNVEEEWSTSAPKPIRGLMG